MKSILTLLVLVFSFQSYALPVAHSLSEVQKDNILQVTSVPGFFDDMVRLAVTVQYSNRCVAGESSLAYKEQDATNLQVFSLWLNETACPAVFSPVERVNILNVHYPVGHEVVINNAITLKVEAPTPAICTKDLCSDGSPRDTYTCACPNGFNK